MSETYVYTFLGGIVAGMILVVWAQYKILKHIVGDFSGFVDHMLGRELADKKNSAMALAKVITRKTEVKKDEH